MSRHLPSLVLALTLVAFLVRAAIYFCAGSILPLVFISAVLLVLLAARLAGRKTAEFAVRAWGVLLALYGVIRLGLAGLLYVAPVGSPHAIAHTGWIFIIVSALYAAAGVYLVLAWRDRFSLKAAG
ncbi:hypothetical protein [Hyphobacterium sp.]|uniref:hypothetical protein n=1 Tax=Hyphobacterium sp. TaxID=2004662 RepID=UPI003BAC3277